MIYQNLPNQQSLKMAFIFPKGETSRNENVEENSKFAFPLEEQEQANASGFQEQDEMNASNVKQHRDQEIPPRKTFQDETNKNPSQEGKYFDLLYKLP